MSAIIDGLLANSPVVGGLLLIWLQQRRIQIGMVKLASEIEGVDVAEFNRQLKLKGD